MTPPLTGPPAGATRPQDERWTPPPGWRGYERTAVTGSGPGHWAAASAAVLEWGVKTRSGFAVEPAADGSRRVVAGTDPWLVAAVGPLRVREPVRVVAVVTEPDRCGFAYGTLPGHLVAGEEAFVVSRAPDGTVSLTLRSLTRSSPGVWRLAFPALLVAQRWYRRRYLRALRGL
ncbi:DUF1990 family protein [Modestobacter sp. SSW1-42]|uniref:DUF1990 family protein n=1 Tax=Modestobacter sp. SSW1-42 TaxID=596372 RepID=UPI0039878ABA